LREKRKKGTNQNFIERKNQTGEDQSVFFERKLA
jgi:hypothetical protein